MAEGKLDEPAAALMPPTIPEEQLFDTEVDPQEFYNLAGSEKQEHREALIRTRAALSVWTVETQDQGVIPGPAEVAAPSEKEMHDWFGTPEWYKQKRNQNP